MSKHTPAPWTAIGPIVKYLNGEICDCRSIWKPGGNPNIEVPESETNARLIAAAPELLEALKELSHYESRDDDDPMLNKARQFAKQTIKKAEGDVK